MNRAGIDITDWTYAVALTVGLACLNVWPDVVGHGFAFAGAADALLPITNGRVFFSCGMAAMMFSCAVWPRFVSHGTGVLRVLVPVLSIAATVVFGLNGGGWVALDAVAALLIGSGYGWYLAQLLTQLSRIATTRTILVLATISLLLKTLIDDGLGILGASAQIASACLMPLAMSGALLLTNRRDAGADQLLDLAEHVKLEGHEHQAMIALLVVDAVLHAVTRAFSNLGLWGEGHLIVGGFSWSFFLVALVLAMAIAASMLQLDRGSLPMRFLPAFLLLLGGYFVLDPQVVVMLGMPEWLSSSLMTALELFAHLLYWMIIAAGVRNLRLPPLRVIGLTVALMDLAAVVLALFVQNFSGMSHMVVMGAMYLFILILVVLFRNTSMPDATVGTDEGQDEPFVSRCRAIAGETGLTPRETEVFMLLAEGRDRAYIQSELYITEATIKTHVQHIYAKLGLHNKQELIALVREESRERDSSHGTSSTW